MIMYGTEGSNPDGLILLADNPAYFAMYGLCTLINKYEVKGEPLYKLKDTREFSREIIKQFRREQVKKILSRDIKHDILGFFNGELDNYKEKNTILRTSIDKITMCLDFNFIRDVEMKKALRCTGDGVAMYERFSSYLLGLFEEVPDMEL